MRRSRHLARIPSLAVAVAVALAAGLAGCTASPERQLADELERAFADAPAVTAVETSLPSVSPGGAEVRLTVGPGVEPDQVDALVATWSDAIAGADVRSTLRIVTGDTDDASLLQLSGGPDLDPARVDLAAVWSTVLPLVDRVAVTTEFGPRAEVTDADAGTLAGLDALLGGLRSAVAGQPDGLGWTVTDQAGVRVEPGLTVSTAAGLPERMGDPVRALAAGDPDGGLFATSHVAWYPDQDGGQVLVELVGPEFDDLRAVELVELFPESDSWQRVRRAVAGLPMSARPVYLFDVGGNGAFARFPEGDCSAEAPTADASEYLGRLPGFYTDELQRAWSEADGVGGIVCAL